MLLSFLFSGPEGNRTPVLNKSIKLSTCLACFTISECFHIQRSCLVVQLLHTSHVAALLISEYAFATAHRQITQITLAIRCQPKSNTIYQLKPIKSGVVLTATRQRQLQVCYCQHLLFCVFLKRCPRSAACLFNFSCPVETKVKPILY